MMKIPQNWTFDRPDVAAGFDLHVREQLPWYDLLTGAVAHVIRHYLPDNGLIYDIGASTGNIGASVAETINVRNARIVAIEKSPDMAAIYRGPGECIVGDALTFDFEPYDVAVCFLVLMFLPTSERKEWLQQLANKAKPGGALIIADKTADQAGYISTVLHRLTLAGKAASGVDAKEIMQKELSLSGVQRPIRSSIVENIAPRPIELFRFGEFACWVAERPE